MRCPTGGDEFGGDANGVIDRNGETQADSGLPRCARTRAGPGPTAATTWLLVRISPSGVRMMPEPNAAWSPSLICSVTTLGNTLAGDALDGVTGHVICRLRTGRAGREQRSVDSGRMNEQNEGNTGRRGYPRESQIAQNQ
jgi:hypothetical protein